VIHVDSDRDYGLGWYISSRAWANGKILFHSGSNDANHSLALVAPLRHVAFLITTNAYDPSGRSYIAMTALLSRLETFHFTGH